MFVAAVCFVRFTSTPPVEQLGTNSGIRRTLAIPEKGWTAGLPPNAAFDAASK